MNCLSVVIITRNEEHNITACIQSAKLITDDIIVVDSESDDNTINLALEAGAKTFSISWSGYGASRNFGASKAKYNWILALDADERITEELALSLQQLKLANENCIYRFKRKNFLAKQEIRLGTLGFETVKRLYNKNFSEWDLTLVHEKLIAAKAERKFIKGHINHYGLKNEADYKGKAVLYAQMSAEKYFLQGKKATIFKRYFSPLFNSAKSYIFQLGFLEGNRGFTIAKTIAYYSWLKYFYLNQLLKEARTKELVFSSKPQIESI